MKLYEYQAKAVLRANGIRVPAGVAVDSSGDPVGAIESLNARKYVVKAQVLTGGRGKAGGVKLAGTREEALSLAKKMIGMDIRGHTVKKVYIEEAADIKNEIYLSFLFDRASGRHMLICSNEGGMDIEAVAAKSPEKVLKMTIDALIGLKAFHIREVLSYLPYGTDVLKNLSRFISDLYRVFIKTDAELVEINPLVIDGKGDVTACDAKMIANDNALFRQKDISGFLDYGDLDAVEAEARKADLSYIKLDGNIGCMVNGAGLAMATMDVIKHFGGSPANFLDIGGGAKADRVQKALGIILMDRKVKAVLINIFGGIVRTDEVAKGFLAAAKNLKIQVPIVIRLVGTNEEEALKLLSENGYRAFSDMNAAVCEVIKNSK